MDDFAHGWTGRKCIFWAQIRVLVPKFRSQDFGLKVLPQSFEPKIGPEVCTTNLVVLQYWPPNLYSKIFASKFGQNMLALEDLFWSNLLVPKLNQLSNFPQLCDASFSWHIAKDLKIWNLNIFIWDDTRAHSHPLISWGLLWCSEKSKESQHDPNLWLSLLQPLLLTKKVFRIFSFSENLDFLRYIVMKDASWDYDFISIGVRFKISA